VPRPDLVVLAGIEVSTRQGHFLVYGVRTLSRSAPASTWPTCARDAPAGRRGGGTRSGGASGSDILKHNRPELDGLEMMSSNMDADCRRRTLDVQQKLGVAGLGNSDAHDVNTLGFCYTEFDAAIRDVRDLVEAIRGRKASPRERRELVRA
jgi:hypothetical protein